MSMNKECLESMRQRALRQDANTPEGASGAAGSGHGAASTRAAEGASGASGAAGIVDVECLECGWQFICDGEDRDFHLDFLDKKPFQCPWCDPGTTWKPMEPQLPRLARTQRQLAARAAAATIATQAAAAADGGAAPAPLWATSEWR